ncbi:MAG: ParB/RepB/Spo0J family partition protein [Rikenellaceae bacterium]
MTQEIKNIKLSTIRVNANNPRKSLGEQTLEELAQSIKAVGVLQPIIVQNTNEPQSEYTFEIICGERRFRASQMLGVETIPAIVKVGVRADEVLEMALTENLLREDIAPIEEMMVYTELIEERNYTVEKLMERFGKSESYIRNRMRLTSLIEEFRTLLTADVITIGTAIELSKYSREIQAEVYDTHFAEGVNYQNWRGNSTKSIAESLERSYSNDLNDYFFDKGDCYDCDFNTHYATLFTDDNVCGRCTHRQCLKSQNTAYIVDRAIKTHENNPELPLARYEYRFDEDAVKQLTDRGYEVAVVDWCRECPVEPDEDDFEDDAEWEAEMVKYGKVTQKLFDQYQSGQIKMYAIVGLQGVTLSYRTLSSSSSSSVAETPLMKLQNQDNRNKEIAIEKIIADTKDVVKSLDVTQGEYSALEEQMIYFNMAKSLRSENFAKVGIDPEKHYLTDCDRWHLVQSLTEEQKIIIKRDFIVSNFSDAARGNYTAVMLMDYAKQHAPDKYEEIQESHNEVYEKRHTRIEEKIAVIAQNEL